ncbi:MAG: hypothetical protein JWO91_1490 [Acidobacteriaceae bacterium]|jgi:hypothetical protein|nr:hypothetical protein [Acidobacteriaceae bacterium]
MLSSAKGHSGKNCTLVYSVYDNHHRCRVNPVSKPLVLPGVNGQSLSPLPIMKEINYLEMPTECRST